MREPQGTWEKGDYKRGRAFLGGGDRVGVGGAGGGHNPQPLTFLDGVHGRPAQRQGGA